MIDLTILYKNRNFRNSQNYIFGRIKSKGAKEFKGGYLDSIYRTYFLEFLNSKYKKYIFKNKFRLFFYKLFYFFGIYSFDVTKIKGLFWQIENVFILKGNVNIFKKIGESFFDVDLDSELGISNEEIILNKSLKGKKVFIYSDKFIFVLKYEASLSSKTFLNYIGIVAVNKEYNIFTKKYFSKGMKYIFPILLLSIILFIFFLFLGIFGFIDLELLKYFAVFIFFILLYFLFFSRKSYLK